ncbi:hypothetical protein AB205_0123750, partial [Aquarana catesbeiana]
GSSNGNPPERCPRPLYSQDSTQEGHTIPHHHQSGNLGDDNIGVKKEFIEEDEEYGVMKQFSEGHKDMMEPPNTRNPPERCPRPLYSWDSTQEDHTIPHHYQSGNLRDSKVEVKEEIKEEDDEDGVMEEEHKDLYQDTMVESSSYRNPPERCLRPLYSRDSTQEGHTIPYLHKSGDPIDIEFEVKSEEEERYVRDDQQSMEEDGITGTFIEEDTPTEISTGTVPDYRIPLILRNLRLCGMVPFFQHIRDFPVLSARNASILNPILMFIEDLTPVRSRILALSAKNCF